MKEDKILAELQAIKKELQDIRGILQFSFDADKIMDSLAADFATKLDRGKL